MNRPLVASTLALAAQPALAAIDIVFNYSADAGGFFASALPDSAAVPARHATSLGA